MTAIAKGRLLAAALPAILALASTGARADITWVKGYDRGLQAAKSQGKPAMMDFTASWCSWCVKLDKDTFTDPSVQDLARSFVCVKVDLDKEKENARKWSIRGIPHILFLAPDGELISRISGYKGPADFAKSMRAALKMFKPPPPPPKPEPKSKRVKTSSPSAPDASEPLFVECARCKNIFNATSAKGACPRCGAPYEVK